MRFSTFTIFAITVSLIAAAPVYTNTSEDALVVRSSPDAAKVDTEDSTASQSGNIESDTKPKTISLNEWLEEGPKILKTLGEVKDGIVEAKKEKKIGNTKANTMVQYVNTATLAIEVYWRLENEKCSS